jgi:hypothetical protein
MSSDKAARSRREPGRPQKCLNLKAGPLPQLAQALRNLRDASGNPTYRTLQKYAGIPHQRLAEAARGEQLPSWPVVQGYLRGCQAYHRHKHKDRPPLDGAADLARWRRLYRDAGGTLPEEDRLEDIGNELTLNPAPAGVPSTAEAETVQPLRLRARPQPAPARYEQAPAAGNRLNRRLLLRVAGVLGIVLLAGVMLDVTRGSGRPSPVTTSTPARDAPMGRNARISVAPPAPACGDAAEDGFRSPATTPFSSIKTVYTLTLDGLSASVMEATYDGISYQWVEAHPTGSRAGMQLRWSPARNQWYYCTATLESGDISALPDMVATTAVPAAIHGRNVIFQACIWHQHPYTARCSPMSAVIK